VKTYLQWERALDAVPTIVDLREKIEDIRKRELDKTLGSLNGISEDEKRAIDIMSQSIVNKLLHAPLVVLKQAASTHSSADNTIAVARKLFNLDKELKRPGHHRHDPNSETSENTVDTLQGSQKKSECR
jgi:glutamyl-tRNA reductase